MRLYNLIEANTRFKPMPFSPHREEVHALVLKTGNSLAEHLLVNCSEWLSQTQNGKIVAYRGFLGHKYESQLAFTRAVRKRRAPKDTDFRIHREFNRMIKTCGKVANRSNAFFASGNKYEAQDYGHVYAVFPSNGFHYTWHEKYTDWTMEGKDIVDLAKTTADDIKLSDEELATIKKLAKKEYEEYLHTLNTDWVEEIQKFLERLGVGLDYEQVRRSLYSDTRILGYIPQAAKPTNEFKYQLSYARDSTLMILDAYRKASEHDKAILAKLGHRAYEKIQEGPHKMPEADFLYRKIMHAKTEIAKKLDTLKKRRENIQKKFCAGLHGDDGSLGRALESGKEVMIASEYLTAVKDEFYFDVVYPLLNGKQPNRKSLSKYAGGLGQ